MSQRDALRDELRIIEDSYTEGITTEKCRRANEIIRTLQQCKCRTCKKLYQMGKSRADLQGFCSAKCQHTKAKQLGYKPSKDPNEYAVLKRHNEVGSVFIISDDETVVEEKETRPTHAEAVARMKQLTDDQRTLLAIRDRLVGIDIADMSTSEKQICRLLEDRSYLVLVYDGKNCTWEKPK